MPHTEANEATPGAGEYAPWIGRVIDDRYRIIELLGEGGMGAVFVAEHLKLRKQVALKTIRAEFAANSQAEARFAREALATAQIDHPHVASAVDFGHLPEGGAYLVIQLVRGESLASRLERGPLGVADLCQLGAQVADALAAAHAAGIVHRDLKPDNILLERRAEGTIHAKVLDFGIARVADDGAVADTGQPLTRAGAVIGTPGYMAPEQAVGGAVDHRVDLYALGVILWESCTGQPLWSADTLTEMFMAQIGRPAPSLLAATPGLPPALAQLIDQLLARKPDERPASAGPVRDVLRRLAVEADASLAAASHSAASHSASHSTSHSGPLAPTLAASGAHPVAPTASPSPSAAFAATISASTAPQPALPALARRSLPARPLMLFGAALALGLVLLYAARGEDSTPPPGTPTAETSAEPAAAVKGGLPARKSLLAEVPPAYVDPAQTLLLSTERRERQRAGEAIAGAPEADKASIPEYLRNIAWLEKVPGCDTKRSILLQIEAADDLRALWALRILADSPRDGCRSFWMREDCLGCLREDLARIVTRFEARAGD